MNHRRSTLLAICIVFVTSLFVPQVTQAQVALPEVQLNNIRQNCIAAQTTLNQLHSSDALLRVNQGSMYLDISTKLMARLNSRIALDRLGGVNLAAITVDYERRLDAFRSSYKEYEESMSSRTLKVDCVERPVEFYENVAASREKRKRLHEDTRALTALLHAYKAEFENFAKDFEGGE